MTGFIKKINKINFGLLSPEDIRAMSAVTVETPDTYEDDGFPIEKGLMDPRMGVIDPSLVCRTCGFRGGDCQGHFGSIELARPVIHAGFGDVIHKILRSTCNECGRVLLNDEQIDYYTEKIHMALNNKKSLDDILKDVYRSSRRELKYMQDYDGKFNPKYCCPHCGAPQELIYLDMPTYIRQGNYKLTASEVRERLERITDEDSFVLGVNPEVARPEWLVLTVLPVPPVTVRPSITIKSGERAEDDLTHKLVDILRINQRLLENMGAGAPHLIVEDLWELLQYHVTTYFDNKALGVPPARHRSGRPLITLMQRLNGHEKDAMHDESKGRFRDNLSGKRVNFSARTVMSPDPNIGINEVGVPEIIAKELTVPVSVTDWNIEEMKKYIINGPDVYPGANYIIRNDRKKIRLRNEETINFVLNQLEPGFIVERHLKDGDVVLLNRQPSLHKLSILAHEVKVMPYGTFRLNPAVCPPYNVDFDGDEMNIHVLQNDETRAEAKSLMLPQDNIYSPRFGGPLIGAIRDHISGAYILTKTGTTFTEEEALQIIRKLGLKMPVLMGGQWIIKQDSKYDDESYIYKNKGESWTGKELFSLTLPNDLNMFFSAEISKVPFINPPEDAVVIIKDGILVQGIIDEAAIGSAKGLIQNKIYNDYGSKKAIEFLEKVTKLSLIALTKIGISNSLNDYEIPKDAYDEIEEQLNSKFADVDIISESYKLGCLKNLPGRNLEETFNYEVHRILKDARDMAGFIAENYFKLPDGQLSFSSFARHSYVMAHTGSKSSMLNITQISACVGQQSIRGETLSNSFKNRGYDKRILPHFKKGELNALSNGFVKSSFLKGLSPIEFFFHAMGGRDTMADKSIRVAASGYMQRRLINALQDLHTDKNGMVKDSRGNVIQTLYGEDGLNPVKLDKSKVVDLNKLVNEIKMNEIDNNFNVVNDDSDTNDDYKEDLSQSELKKLKIKSKNLYNKFQFISQDYSNFIKKANFELETIDDKDVNDDIKRLMLKLMIRHQSLLDYQKQCSNLNILDDLTNELEKASIDLKNAKKDFYQNISKIKEAKYEKLNEKFKEYTTLIMEVEKVIDNKLRVFSMFDSKLYELITNTKEFSENVDNVELLDNLNKLQSQYEKNYENLNNIINNFSKKDFNDFANIQQVEVEMDNVNTVLYQVNQINIESFENNLIEHEKIYKNLLNLDNKINSGNVAILLKKFEKIYKRPMFKRKLKKYNMEISEFDIVKKSIEEDILNQVITDENTDFNKIIEDRCGEFREKNSRLSENEIDNLLNDFHYSDIDDNIVMNCKIKVKNDFLEGKIKLNHVELKLNSYISKKIHEINQLKELNNIKNNPNIPEIKIHLTSEENNQIYKITENEIFSEYGIRGNVETRVEYLIRDKIRENQSEARGNLNIIRRDFSNILELTQQQQEDFINLIEFYINENKIKKYDITEENIIKLSVEFLNTGDFNL